MSKARLEQESKLITPGKTPTLEEFNAEADQLYQTINNIIDDLKELPAGSQAPEKNLLSILFLRCQFIAENLNSLFQHFNGRCPNPDYYYIHVKLNIYLLIMMCKLKRVANLAIISETPHTLLSMLNKLIKTLIADEVLNESQKENLKADLLKEQRLFQQTLSLSESLVEIQIDSLLFAHPNSKANIDLDPTHDLFSPLSKHKRTELLKENKTYQHNVPEDLTLKIIHDFNLAINYLKLGKFDLAITLLTAISANLNSRASSLQQEDILQIWGPVYLQRLLAHYYEQLRRYRNIENPKDTENAYACYVTGATLLAKAVNHKQVALSNKQVEKIKAFFKQSLDRVKELATCDPIAKPERPPVEKVRKKPRKPRYRKNNTNVEASEKNFEIQEIDLPKSTPSSEFKQKPAPVESKKIVSSFATTQGRLTKEWARAVGGKARKSIVSDEQQPKFGRLQRAPVQVASNTNLSPALQSELERIPTPSPSPQVASQPQPEAIAPAVAAPVLAAIVKAEPTPVQVAAPLSIPADKTSSQKITAHEEKDKTVCEIKQVESPINKNAKHLPKPASIQRTALPFWLPHEIYSSDTSPYHDGSAYHVSHSLLPSVHYMSPATFNSVRKEINADNVTVSEEEMELAPKKT